MGGHKRIAKSLLDWDQHFEGKKATTGLEVDGYIFQQIFKPLRTRIEHRAFVDITAANGNVVRLFMEHAFYEDLLETNWFMINHELLTPEDMDILPEMDMLICKTKVSLKLLKRYKKKMNHKYQIFYLGFTSIIRPSAHHQMDYNKFLHLAGASWMKNTPAILQAWSNHPEWPTITILCRKYCYDNIKKVLKRIRKPKRNKGKGLPKNIILHTELLPWSTVDELLGTSGVQLVPSQSEGWGHYIHEAKAHKALCVYTDYPPMSEFFTQSSGVPISKGRKIKMLSELPGVFGFDIDPKGVEIAVNKILDMPYQKRKQMGENARYGFYKSRKHFLERAAILRQKLR